MSRDQCPGSTSASAVSLSPELATARLGGPAKTPPLVSSGCAPSSSVPYGMRCPRGILRLAPHSALTEAVSPRLGLREGLAVTLSQLSLLSPIILNSFILSSNSFDKWKLNAYYVPGIVLGVNVLGELIIPLTVTGCRVARPHPSRTAGESAPR